MSGVDDPDGGYSARLVHEHTAYALRDRLIQ
jgi:hypothetical protein